MPNTVLDPGHGGGRTAGGSSALGIRGPAGTLEKDVTLAVARHVAASLGADVMLTRMGDENPTLAARARRARDTGARVFLSLHANGGAPGARGSELWVHSRGGAASTTLARQLRGAIARLGILDHGIKAADMGVLRPEHLAPGAAACLLELDFLSHPEGERRLRDPAALASLGRAIADGVRAFLASGLDTTELSPQKEQSDAVLAHVAQSLGVAPDRARGWLDAVGASGKYPYIDSYMGAISEVAALVLAQATRDVGSLDEVIAAVVARFSGDDGVGRRMLDGSMNEPKLLLEIGAEATRRLPASAARYRELVDRFAGSGLAYFFHPSDAPGGDVGAEGDVEEIRYALQDGSVNKVARVERVSGIAALVFDWMGQRRRVLLGEVVDAPAGKPSTSGWQIAAGRTTTLASVVSYILLYACGKWGKRYGTEITFEVDGQRWLAKKANHNDTTSGGPRNFDHPGMDVYVAVAALAAGVQRRRARALDVTMDSPQTEQSDAVLEGVARSMQEKEGTRYNQLHYDSNVVNFGIGSWTGPRIATVLDMYETVAGEQGKTATVYGYFGGQTAFNDLRSRFRANAIGVPMVAADKSALESLGGDASLQGAQLRLLAKEVKTYVDAIASDNKYPFIDGYMNAISEVAAHVLAHAWHQHGQVNDLIAEVITNHGGDVALGKEITDGTMTERKFLSEIGAAVVRRVKAKYQDGVRKRYQDVIAQFDGSGLSYFFDPQPPATANALLAPPNWCQIKQDIVTTATSEEQVWVRTDGTKAQEADANMLDRLRAYWRDGAGVANWSDKADLSAADDPNEGPWSAALVSWVLRAAGVPVGAGFKFSGLHLQYIVEALRNRESSDMTKPFWLYGVDEQDQAQPRLGDILCFNRGASNFTYGTLRSRFWGNSDVPGSGAMHCNIVVDFVQRGTRRFLRSIGGNVHVPGDPDPHHGSTVGFVDEMEVNDSGVILSPPAHYLGFIALVGC